MSPAPPDGLPIGARRFPVWGYVVIIVVYLAIVQSLPYLTTRGMDIEYGKYPDSETVLRALVLPIGITAVLAAIIVTVLGWWGPVWRDHRPVRRWVRVVPILLIAAVLVGTNYAKLADRGLGYSLLFLFGALLVGFTEETMFRGIGVWVFRSNGFGEAKVALWTCLIFGLAHGTNIFTEGAGAILQVLVTAIAGYFFYLTRRTTGFIVVAMVIHALWDFGLFTTNLSDPMYTGAVVFILMDIVLAIVLLVRRKHIELPVAERTWA